MKSLLNWRYYVIYALLAIGIISVLGIFSEEERPFAEWLKVRVYLALIATASFYVMNRLRIRWESRGEIAELKNQ